MFGGDQTAMRDNDYVPYSATAYTAGNGPASPDDEEAWNRRNNNLYDVDLGTTEYAESCKYYDVDDYARDWADIIGLKDLLDEGSAEVLLPSIFTIGFGLPFNERTNTDGTSLNILDNNDAIAICNVNPADCLGVQLLRYIADVGDNNKIDNDYNQDLMQDRTAPFRDVDGVLVDDDFDLRGPCPASRSGTGQRFLP